nr:MAG TPA: hypothetical protein [Caudoviricetes sp.]
MIVIIKPNTFYDYIVLLYSIMGIIDFIIKYL